MSTTFIACVALCLQIFLMFGRADDPPQPTSSLIDCEPGYWLEQVCPSDFRCVVDLSIICEQTDRVCNNRRCVDSTGKMFKPFLRPKELTAEIYHSIKKNSSAETVGDV